MATSHTQPHGHTHARPHSHTHMQPHGHMATLPADTGPTILQLWVWSGDMARTRKCHLG